MKRLFPRWSTLAFAFAAAFSPLTSSGAADVVVFAAASLKESMDEQARMFLARTGHRVIVSYGASNALARQIEAGAPADLFISADVDWMDYLSARGLIASGTRVDLLRNSLVLVAPANSTASLKIGPPFALDAALGKDRLAMANPESVPAGRYARSALRFLGVWDTVEKKIVRTENVRAALLLVSRNEAPFGIVYATDAMADAGVKVVGALPAESHPPIVYPAAVLASSKSPAARLLLDHLRGTDARKVWTRFGFVANYGSEAR